MSDLTSKTVEELNEWALSWGSYAAAFDEMKRRLEEAQHRSEARDAEVAAKSLEEAIPLIESCFESPNWGRVQTIPTVETTNMKTLKILSDLAAEYRAKAGRKE